MLVEGTSPFLFPNRGSKQLEEKQLRRMFQKHNIAAVPHGFRSSFRDWAAEETNHPREVIEAALAHVSRPHPGTVPGKPLHDLLREPGAFVRWADRCFPWIPRPNSQRVIERVTSDFDLQHKLNGINHLMRI